MLSAFKAAIQGSDHDVDLFGAAMLIARLGGGRPDPHTYARKLDLFAEAALEQAAGSKDRHELTHAIDHQLFQVEGFHGNSASYDDPANSFLDQVIDRRTGIPITLSLAYMEVAQRVGLECAGIGYPGHFIVRCGPAEDPVYLDPFNQGIRLDRDELLAGLRSRELGKANPETYLAAVTRRQVLQRMLNNLYGVYRARGDAEPLMAVVELMLALEPWNAALVGERGLLHYRLGNLRAAFTDLETYTGTREGSAVPVAARLALAELRIKFAEHED